jgi:tetratricopeptide (TPR) repeat protein
MLLPGLLVLALPVQAVAQGRVALDAQLKRAQSRIAKGQRLLTDGDFKRAETAFREAMKLRPDLPGSYLGLGAALVGQKKFAEALPVLHEAEDRFVSFERSLQSAELKNQQYSGDRQSLATRRIDPSQPGGQEYNTRGGGQASIDLIKARLAAAPNLKPEKWSVDEFSVISPQVFYFEGLASLHSGDRNEGVRALQQCLALDPTYGLAHYNLAVAEFMAGHVREAKQHLDAALTAGVKANPKFVSDVDAALKRAR